MSGQALRLGGDWICGRRTAESDRRVLVTAGCAQLHRAPLLAVIGSSETIELTGESLMSKHNA